MLKNHKQQNDEWIGRMRDELNEERRVLAEEKAAAEAANADLARQQETFQQKSKKLDAIMRQVQGLKD
jgi:peptidoglycan hydrolase CwlO-like protein